MNPVRTGSWTLGLHAWTASKATRAKERDALRIVSSSHVSSMSATVKRLSRPYRSTTNSRPAPIMNTMRHASWTFQERRSVRSNQSNIEPRCLRRMSAMGGLRTFAASMLRHVDAFLTLHRSRSPVKSGSRSCRSRTEMVGTRTRLVAGGFRWV